MNRVISKLPTRFFAWREAVPLSLTTITRGELRPTSISYLGELGRGTRGAWGSTVDGWYEQHPETGVQILHRKLPCWTELLDLVHYAHGSAFSDQVVIGWDVALLDSGPCLIEINKAPDLDIIQRIGSGPVKQAARKTSGVQPETNCRGQASSPGMGITASD